MVKFKTVCLVASLASATPAVQAQQGVGKDEIVPGLPASIDTTSGFSKPAGTIDADSFMRDFRFEEYISSSKSDSIFRGIARHNAIYGKHKNSFEKELAISELATKQYNITTEKKQLPDYLIFSIFFSFGPTDYRINEGLLYLIPNYAYKPKEDSGFVAPGRAWDRDYENYSAVYWERGMVKNESKTKETGRVMYESNTIKNYLFGLTVESNFTIANGSFETKSNFQKYTEKSSNMYAFVPLSVDEFRLVLSSKKQFYKGYSIVKVDKNSLHCANDGGAVGTKAVKCVLKTMPYKYIVFDFNGNSINEFLPQNKTVKFN